MANGQKEYYFFTAGNKAVFCNLETTEQFIYLVNKLNDPVTQINDWGTGNFEYRADGNRKKIFFTVIDKHKLDFTEIIGGVINAI